MSKRAVIILNLLLAGFLAVNFIALCREIRYTESGKSQRPASSQVEIKRPVVRVASKYRPLFGLEPTKGIRPGINIPGDNDSQARNELILSNARLRIKGIFISGVQACVVVSLLDDRQKGAETTLEKVETGSSIKGFTVTDIRPGVVTLTNKNGESIKLKIFKPQ